MTHQILIVDDEIRYRELYAQVLSAAGFETRVAAGPQEALAIIGQGLPSLVVSDVRMPGSSGLELLQAARRSHPNLPFLLVTAYADVRDAVNALKLGAVDYLTKPVDLEELLAAVRDGLGVYSGSPLPEFPDGASDGIVAASPGMRTVLRDAFRIAASDANVLIIGESGSGKEVVAQFIHRQSRRKAGPMKAINCAAIPANLLASELFGHEKGAFTGAVIRRPGLFREAAGGTLFLDEIGEMPAELQAALLRAIETGCILPVGSDKEVAVDYRLLAATNRNLMADVAAGRFRQDLYYRLNVIAIEIPPLRERPEDILALARHFLSRSSSDGKRLSRAAIKALAAHCWPGIVRELANAMEHARLLSQADVILPEHLPPAVRHAAARAATVPRGIPSPANTPAPDVKTLEQSEIEAIRQALVQTRGNRTRAAELLGITRRGLIYKLKRFGLE